MTPELQKGSNMEKSPHPISGKIRYLSFGLLEALIFILFYLNLGITSSDVPFYLYIGLFPLIAFFLVYISPGAKKDLRHLLVSKDMVVLISVIVVWVYIYELENLPVSYIFSTLYFPVLIDEINFRFIVTSYVSEKIGMGKAVVVQALLFTLLYSGYLIILPGSYPGPYAPLFVIDMVAVGLIYGAVYYLRRNLYIDISTHLSLWLMAAVIPYLLVWIPYTFAPT